MDRLTPDRRSENMRRIRSVNTGPETKVRRVAHALGYRFRLYRRDLPGSPDLVFSRFRAVVFVHGCFWHHHGRCRAGRIPLSNEDFWRRKLVRNVNRDRRNKAALRRLGWRVLTIWECQTARVDLAARIVRFLTGVAAANPLGGRQAQAHQRVDAPTPMPPSRPLRGPSGATARTRRSA